MSELYVLQKMRIHIIWAIASGLLVVILSATVIYQRSSIPHYSEAETLLPTVAEFGHELAILNSKQSVTGDDIQKLLSESRFKAIQSYGVVFSEDSQIIVSIRVNKIFSFDITQDGHSQWNQK